MPVDAIAELARLGFSFPFSGGDHNTDGDSENEDGNAEKDDAKPDSDSKDDGKKKPEFTDEQAAEVRRLSQKAAKDAADKARAEERQKIADEKQRADEEADRKKDEDAGKYEEAKAKIEKRATDAETERDEVKATNEALLKILKVDVDATWKDIPAEVKETYDGDDDDVLAKKQHMQRNAKIIDRLTDKSRKPRVPGDPDPDTGKPEIKNVIPTSKMH